MTQFVNIHGQPIDAKIWYSDQAKKAFEARKVAPRRKPTLKRGYAANPGTGPEGETCKTCAYKVSGSNAGGSKHFLKCDLRRATWTHGEGTDILARSPACIKWTPIDAAIKGAGGEAAPPAQPWPIRGARVEGDSVIVLATGGNDAARWLCGAILAMKGSR